MQNLGLRYTRYYDDIYVSSLDKIFYEYVTEIKTCIFSMFKTIDVKPHRGKGKKEDKSQIRKKSKRITVHDLTVNSGKLSPSKERVSKVRKLIYIFRSSVKANLELEKLIKQYRSLDGHIITLKSQGYVKHLKLKKELLGIVLEMDEKAAKKYARQFRKVKTKKQLYNLSAKVSVLKKINSRVSSVIEAEKKTAKLRIVV